MSFMAKWGLILISPVPVDHSYTTHMPMVAEVNKHKQGKIYICASAFLQGVILFTCLQQKHKTILLHLILLYFYPLNFPSNAFRMKRKLIVFLLLGHFLYLSQQMFFICLKLLRKSSVF